MVLRFLEATLQDASIERSGPFREAARILEQAIGRRAFPAAVAEVGNAMQPLWEQAFGHLTYDEGAPSTRPDSVFDLASLTKVAATVPLAMQQVERGALALDDPVAHHLSSWVGADRADVTVRDLLAHCSGLPAWAPLFRTCRGRHEFERAICASTLEYAPRTKAIYSDLGFILLGFILERDSSLSERFDTLRAQMHISEDVQYHPPREWLWRTAPTEQDPWRGRLLAGEVHDENASALGGAAAHAGLFGTAAALGQYARHVLQVLGGHVGAFQSATVREFIARRDIPSSSRALGWDTSLPTSSCGTRMSSRAFGHTGFTGTSLWIDPERGVYVVLLTNRVHPTRANESIRQVRPAFHDAVIDAFDQSGVG